MWAGNSVLPRVGQVRNVLIAIHRVPESHWFPGSHAYLPRDRFDQVREQAGWILARKAGAFLALRSQHAARWTQVQRNQWQGWELRADACDNAWICEMGHVDQWQSFDAFCEAILTSEPSFADQGVTYRSPSVGVVRMGWSGPMTLDGKPVDLRFDQRYGAPFLKSGREGKYLLVEKSGHRLELDFEHHRRRVD